MLLILKILGMLILGVIVLLLLLLCAALFAPVRYRLKAVWRKDERTADGSVRWLLGAASLRYHLDGGEQRLEGRLFGIPVWRPFGRKDGAKAGPARTEETDEPEPAGPAPIPPVRPAPAPSDAPAPSGRPASEAPVAETPASEAPVAEGADVEAAAEAPASEEPAGPRRGRAFGFFRRLLYAIRFVCVKIKTAGKRIAALPGRLKRAAGTAADRLRGAKERLENLWQFWNLEEHVRARETILRELRFLWKRSRPRRADGRLRFGFDDPSLTGQCMGLLAALSAWYPGSLDLEPEFDQTVFEGELLIKGYVQMYAPALSAFRIWRDPDVRSMYRRWKQ
ncbi:MAG: hypothetical protein Q4C82_06255 [Eubacteriales bacterium]|nr:hypothetical protein [Eubacteriales bacterium]